jgi:hypothetical protein
MTDHEMDTKPHTDHAPAETILHAGFEEVAIAC